MTLTDPIGDMFSRIRNGQMRSLNSIDIPSSNFRQNILKSKSHILIECVKIWFRFIHLKLELKF